MSRKFTLLVKALHMFHGGVCSIYAYVFDTHLLRTYLALVKVLDQDILLRSNRRQLGVRGVQSTL